MQARNVLIGLAIVLIAIAVFIVAVWFDRQAAVTVNVEVIQRRNLQSIVSASGKIQPRRLVSISTDTPGRVVELAVSEGERVTRGQFLLQIDPRSLRTRVESGSASLQAAEATLEQSRQTVVTAQVQVEQARQDLARQQELWTHELTTLEALERTQYELRAAESTLRERERQVAAQAARITQERAALESARYDLSRVQIESPIDGIVIRRNIQEGETAVVGTMNNPGTVLLTLADMSIIQAEVEVDETSIPYVSFGQPAAVTIDALPGRSFAGHVTEIGNSPIQTDNSAGASQATNFKVVVILDEDIPEVRPGFTCTADVTTATRHDAVAVPIQAVAARELILDANGQIVRQPPNQRRPPVEPAAVTTGLEPGHTRVETEGVFVVRDGRGEFVPIELGIVGEQYFEVVSGLKAGDEVITGPYNSVRHLADGDSVQIESPRR